MASPGVGSGRLVIYGVNYDPEPTGIGPYTAELARALAAQDWDVQVVTCFPHYPQWKVAPRHRRRLRATENDGTATITRLWSFMPSPMSTGRRGLFELSYLAGAFMARPRDARVVVGVVPGLSSGLAAVLHARRGGQRTVLIVQDLIAEGLVQSGAKKQTALTGLVRRIEGRMLRSASTVIAISESFVPHLLAAGVDSQKIEVLPNWHRRSREQPESDASSGTVVPAQGRRSAEQAIDVVKSPPTFVHTGSMGIKQGLEQVIEAARIAERSHPSWRFLLVGDGAARPDLERLARGLSNVQFHDPLGDQEYEAALQQASALLVSQAATNRDMSFPSKLAAYFAAGRPVVAAVPTGGSVGQFLRRTGAGVVVEAGDAAALVAALECVLVDQRTTNELVAAALRYLEEHWRSDIAIERWVGAVLGPSRTGQSS